MIACFCRATIGASLHVPLCHDHDQFVDSNETGFVGTDVKRDNAHFAVIASALLEKHPQPM